MIPDWRHADNVHEADAQCGPTGRRTLCVAALSFALLLAMPRIAGAQATGRVARIGFLVEPSLDQNMQQGLLEPFRQELRRLGYIEGRNLVLEIRSAEGTHARLRGLADELLRLDLDVLVAAFPAPAMTAKDATRTVPVVTAGVDDPVHMGLAQTMARPGGNITGISGHAGGLVAKRVQLVREFVPHARRIAILANPDAGLRGGLSGVIPDWERTLGVQIRMYHAREPGEFDGVFAAMARDGIDGLVVLADNNSYTHRVRLNQLCLDRRMPSVWGGRDFLTGGGLASYQSDFPAMFRRAAALVDRILKGEQPATMAFEQATKLELVIDKRAAKALGITVPQARLVTADAVLE